MSRAHDVPFAELIEAARRVLGPMALRVPDFQSGCVAAALQSGSGRIFTGVSIDVGCGIGFCAELSAIAEMLKHREARIRAIVAVGGNGVLPPCGRCRELMTQLSAENADTVVILGNDRTALLRELLPEYWL